VIAPFRSRDLISAITASGTLAGVAPSITKPHVPGAQRACHHPVITTQKGIAGKQWQKDFDAAAAEHAPLAQSRAVDLVTLEVQTMQRQRCAVGLQAAGGPVGHSAAVFPGPARGEFRWAKIAFLNLADDAKDSAVAKGLAAQGCRHIREEGRAVLGSERRSGA
jgi:hypothetical protein